MGKQSVPGTRHRNVFPKHATTTIYWWIVKIIAGLWLLGHFFGHR